MADASNVGNRKSLKRRSSLDRRCEGKEAEAQ